jgi:hypothetical protein
MTHNKPPFLIGAVLGLISLLALVFLALDQGQESQAQSYKYDCTPTDFSISVPKIRIDGDFLYFTGVITNGCTQSAGPRLKWTAYYSDGTVAFSDEVWPASTINIAPHTNYAFELMHPAPQGRLTYEFRIVSIDRW